LSGTPTDFDYYLVLSAIFVFENQLPGIVYYRELRLTQVVYYTESSEITLFSAKA